MSRNHTNPLLTTTQSPWISLVWVFCLVTLGALIGQLVVSISYKEDLHAAFPPKQGLLILQALTASSAFIAAPVLYLQIFTQQGLRGLFQWRQSYMTPMILTLVLVLTFMVVDIWLIQWNAAIRLPIWLKTFETWAQEKEASLQEVTALLTTFSSLSELGVGILVMAVIPAIGEELLFRGLIQSLCHEATKNIHLSIGISAFVFSTIHFQFYGFIPRFLLGILFGYIYWWTRDLLFPMVAHLFNNTFVLSILFMHQKGIVAYDIFTTSLPPQPVLILFAIATLVLANRLQQHGKRVYKV